MVKNLFFILLLSAAFVADPGLSAQARPGSKPKITFVELGSVNCIPCKKMQPIMKSVEQRYGDQVKVVFHDVWKEDQKHYSKKYGIRLIPTQVFLGSDGKEIFRHEGFFPEKDIDKFLQSKGVTPLKNTGRK